MTGQEKCDLCNTGDCLIEVTAWTGLTVYNKPEKYSTWKCLPNVFCSSEAPFACASSFYMLTKFKVTCQNERLIVIDERQRSRNCLPFQSTRLHSWCHMIRAAQSYAFYLVLVDHCLSFDLFILATVLSVLLRFSGSVYPFIYFQILVYGQIYPYILLFFIFLICILFFSIFLL